MKLKKAFVRDKLLGKVRHSSKKKKKNTHIYIEKENKKNLERNRRKDLETRFRDISRGCGFKKSASILVQFYPGVPGVSHAIRPLPGESPVRFITLIRVVKRR